MKLSLKLTIGYLSIAVITISVALFGMGALFRVNNTYNSPLLEALVSLEELKFAGLRVVASTSETLVLLGEGALVAQKEQKPDDDAEEEELGLLTGGVDSFYAAYERYFALRDMYEISDLEEAQDIKALGKKLFSISSKLIITKKTGGYGAEILEMKEDLEQAERSFLAYLDAVIKKEEALVAGKILDVRNYHARILYLVIFLGGFSLLFAVVYGLMQARSIASIVGRLADKADMIGRGRSGEPLEIDSRDELADLASSFNQMEKNLHDIEEEREASRKRFEDYAEKLKRNSEEFQEFVFIASHDLQEPLRKITTFCQMIKSGGEEESAENREKYLARLSASADRMRDLLDDLLDYNRMVNQEPDMGKIDLNEVVVEVVAGLHSKIEDLGAEVNFDWLPVMKGDEKQIKTLIYHLVDNGLKFRRPEVAPAVNINCEPDNDCWKITVVDNGTGFDLRYTDRIFGVFQKLHGPGTHDGTGMGLALCRKIVENHEGDMKVESVVGEGSKFTVTLPAEQG